MIWLVIYYVIGVIVSLVIEFNTDKDERELTVRDIVMSFTIYALLFPAIIFIMIADNDFSWANKVVFKKKKIDAEPPPPKYEIIQDRMCGNTTRQVDAAIQTIFAGKLYVARDHYQHGNNRRANERLFHKIMDRLKFEHPVVFEKISFNKNMLHIQFEEATLFFREYTRDGFLEGYRGVR